MLLFKIDVEVILDRIYYRTNNFASLRDRLVFGKKWNLANIMLIILMLLLLIVAFQQFQMIYVVVFLVAAVIVIGYYVYLACQERSLDKAIGEYEGIIEEVLYKANEELMSKQLKFTVMKVVQV